MNKFTFGFLAALSLFTQNTLAADTDSHMVLAVANTGSSYNWTPDMEKKEQLNQKSVKNLDKAVAAMNQKLSLQMEARIEEMMELSLHK